MERAAFNPIGESEFPCASCDPSARTSGGLVEEDGHRLLHKELPCDLAANLQLIEPYQDRIATIAVESTSNNG